VNTTVKAPMLEDLWKPMESDIATTSPHDRTGTHLHMAGCDTPHGRPIFVTESSEEKTVSFRSHGKNRGVINPLASFSGATL